MLSRSITPTTELSYILEGQQLSTNGGASSSTNANGNTNPNARNPNHKSNARPFSSLNTSSSSSSTSLSTSRLASLSVLSASGPNRVKSHPPQSKVSISRRRSIDFNPQKHESSSTSTSRSSSSSSSSSKRTNFDDTENLLQFVQLKRQSLHNAPEPDRCNSVDSVFSQHTDDSTVPLVHRLPPQRRSSGGGRRGSLGRRKRRSDGGSLSFDANQENAPPAAATLDPTTTALEPQSVEMSRRKSDPSVRQRPYSTRRRRSMSCDEQDYMGMQHRSSLSQSNFPPRNVLEMQMEAETEVSAPNTLNTTVPSDNLNNLGIPTSSSSSIPTSPCIRPATNFSLHSEQSHEEDSAMQSNDSLNDSSDDEPESERKPPNPNPPLSSMVSPVPGMSIMDCDDDDDDFPLLPDGPNMRGDRRCPCVLPTTNTHHRFDPCIRMITPHTVKGLITGEFADQVDQFLIIDCRFPFEYDGGHIQGAVNFWNTERAVHCLFVDPMVKPNNESRTVIIFHCEFSSVRAPTMLKAIRSLDEELTNGRKGQLFPELYIMEGGYSVFFKEHEGQFCAPKTYTKMKDRRFVQENCQHESIMRRSWVKTSASDGNHRHFPGLPELKTAIENRGVKGWLDCRTSSPQCSSHMVSPRTPLSQVLN